MRVLFVCTGNLYRSPLAEALWGSLRNDRIDSAGTSAAAEKERKAPVRWSEFAASRGVNLERHRSKGLGDADWLLTYSLIVGMQPSHVRKVTERMEQVRPRRRPPILNLGEIVGEKKIPDPAFLYPGEWPLIFDLMTKALLALAVTISEEEQ